MKDFYRSLQYLWPYRGRLAVSLVCVVIIAGLWGSGFGLAVPCLKVLLDDEGLHGWAWRTLVEERLGVTVVQRIVPATMRIQGQSVSIVADIVDLDKSAPAGKAGIKANDWLIGLDDGVAEHRLMRADALARLLANIEPKTPIRLIIFDQTKKDNPIRTVQVTPVREGRAANLLAQVARAIDEPQNRKGRYPILLMIFAIAIVATWLRNLMRFSQEYLVQTAVFRACMDIRCENYGITLRLPMTYFAEKGTSDIMSRFIADTGELSRGMTTLLGKTLVEPAKAVGTIAFAFFLSWEATLIAMLAGPVVFFLIRQFGKIMKHASRKNLEGWSKILGTLEETLTGVRVVKAYTMEKSEQKRFKGVNREVYKQQRRMTKIDSASSPAVEAIGITAGLGAAALAGYWVLVQQTMSPYVFMAWVACLAGMFDPMRKLSKVVTRFHRADAAAQRVFELHDQEQEKSPPEAPELPRHERSVEFRQVSFKYPSASVEALKNINLKINAGDSIAFVGPNGSGKTTLVSMVGRLLDPSEGLVLIDDGDVSQYSIRSLRGQISVVTQDAILFNATIAENISYGTPDAAMSTIVSAAEKAFVDEFVSEMPDGYDTMVGEHGATLSGGQKQRITIARAILRDPAILIFDEAMSQVDADSERRIHEALARIVKDRTTLIVAHRFATVLNADRIVVMDAGKIIDCGMHEQLLARCELYRKLYETQFIDSSGQHPGKNQST